MIKIPTTLVEELIRLNLLQKKDSKAYEELARKEDKELGQILIEKDIVSAGDLLEIKSRLYHLPIIKLEEIQLDNVERVVIWRGLELNNKIEERLLAKMEAEYQLGRSASLRVTAEENQAKKEYLTVGPKIKF